ncbi:shadow of prion protein 2 [Xyrichtys novacula]|uniref:Shadow of prion protein 2 n=1 Tax=Xyrichtys novacula TaxID=13765 RepID=A0AAV1GB96_XYRNO|nr:shadow of prion protein 2 [Xyrichtys novacula]
MLGQQKLLSLWLCLLIMAAFCPGAQYVYGRRRGGFFKSRGKESTNKEPSSQGHGLPKQGLKLAGAAAVAAGALGGTGTGLGLLGHSKHGSVGHHGSSSSKYNHQLYYEDPQGFYNETLWTISASTGGPAPDIFLTLGHVMFLLVAAWIRGM